MEKSALVLRGFMTTNQQLDIELLNGYLEALDLDVITQMLDLYIQQSKLYLADIASAIQIQDEKAWQEQCHKMKGSAASAGLSLVHGKLVNIEKSTETIAVKSSYLNDLTALNEQAIEAFKQWLAKQ